MGNQVWKYEPSDRWVRVVLQGETIVDSKRPMLMLESRGEQDYYFPKEDVANDVLVPSDHVETSGYRGVKRFWHVQVGDHVVENGAWRYDAKENRPDLNGRIAFDWNKMDHWYEEDEEVFYHPRNPYHRVDTIPSSRHVEVIVDGVTVAETKRPFLLFETSIATRYYIPQEDVNFDFLTPNDLQTYCPYKGFSSYYNLNVNGDNAAVIENAVWTYPDPIPEAPKLKNTIAFWPEKDKRIQIKVDREMI